MTTPDKSHEEVLNTPSAGEAPMDPTKTVIENLTWILEHAGICEIGAFNVSVASYMKHWEGRTEKAESQVSVLRQELAQAKEELDQMRDERWMLEDKLYNSAMDLVALEGKLGKLGEMRRAGNEMYSQIEEEFGPYNKCAREDWDKALAALEPIKKEEI